LGQRIEKIGDLGTYDQVFVSPHPDDAGFSCPAALLRARDEGRRALVAVVFTRGDGGPAETECARRIEEEAAAAGFAGFDFVTADFPDAPFRGPQHRDFNGFVWGDGPRDAEIVRDLAAWISAVLTRASPREWVAPLGVGRHIDHRLVHDACRAAPAGCAEAAWFYEDRPYAFVDQAAELRLREIGCDLVLNPDRFFRSFWKARYVEAHLTDRRERMECRTRYERRIPGPPATLPRPSSRVVESCDFDSVWRLVSSYASQVGEFLGERGEFAKACEEAARRQGSNAPYCERAWSLCRPGPSPEPSGRGSPPTPTA
jgi:LmbE family N-acetylglucosaminyl deacetylase